MTNYYTTHADRLTKQYNQTTFQAVHKSWLHQLPAQPGAACDIGAGSGRDANGLASLGWQVTAVEPCSALRELAQVESHGNVFWLDDSLPALDRLRAKGQCQHQGQYQGQPQRFDLILISAVWMHLSAAERERGFAVVSELLAPGGLLVISLRQGPDDGRGFFSVSAGELEQQALAYGLLPCGYDQRGDDFGRAGVSWETCVLRRPLSNNTDVIERL